MPTFDSPQSGDITEKLTASGEAANVLDANRSAWEAMESVLGPDTLEGWSLSEIAHAVVAFGKLEWIATFTRDPDVPTPPNVVLTNAALLPTDEDSAPIVTPDKTGRAA